MSHINVMGYDPYRLGEKPHQLGGYTQHRLLHFFNLTTTCPYKKKSSCQLQGNRKSLKTPSCGGQKTTPNGNPCALVPSCEEKSPFPKLTIIMFANMQERTFQFSSSHSHEFGSCTSGNFCTMKVKTKAQVKGEYCSH